MAKLNLDTFNEILMKAVKPGKELEVLEMEVNCCALIFDEAVGKLLDMMDAYEASEFPEDVAKQFQTIKNIESNTESLLEKVAELKEKESV